MHLYLLKNHTSTILYTWCKSLVPMLREFVMNKQNMFSIYNILEIESKSWSFMVSIVLKAYKFREKRAFRLMVSLPNKMWSFSRFANWKMCRGKTFTVVDVVWVGWHEEIYTDYYIKVGRDVHKSFINLALCFNRQIALYNHCQLRKTACHPFCKSTNSDHIHSQQNHKH